MSDRALDVESGGDLDLEPERTPLQPQPQPEPEADREAQPGLGPDCSLGVALLPEPGPEPGPGQEPGPRDGLELTDVEINDPRDGEKPGGGGGGGGGDTNGLKAKLGASGSSLCLAGAGAGAGGAEGQRLRAPAPAAARPPATGLTKEELLEAAGGPGWRRLRWALLGLFWLGWAAMLAGAVAIIVQAPRCRPLPHRPWWAGGPGAAVYQLPPGGLGAPGDPQAGDMTELARRIEDISKLKVKALLIGPLHRNPPDDLSQTQLTDIQPELGTLDQLRTVLDASKRKGIKMILDLTPNYNGADAWFGLDFSQVTPRRSSLRMKEALMYWLDQGFDGLRLGAIERVMNSSAAVVNEWKTLVNNISTEDKPRILIGAVTDPDADPGDVRSLVELSELEMVCSYYLRSLTKLQSPRGEKAKRLIEDFIQSANNSFPCWSVGGREGGHLGSLLPEYLQRIFQLLLFTLPGTPFTYYGDEIGLKDIEGQGKVNTAPPMQWESLPGDSGDGEKISVEAQSKLPNSTYSLFRSLSSLRSKERSLMFGSFETLSAEGDVYVYRRLWDQSERFLIALNLGLEDAGLDLSSVPGLPPTAALEISTTSRAETSLPLNSLKLAPGEGLLLKYPYSL